YLFSLPNNYLYSGLIIPTMDMFFECKVSALPDDIHAADDASELLWLRKEEINPEAFGLGSIRKAVTIWYKG
ncbi:MAG: DNA mismatch repair protein MutT, partial [Prevotella sp.]|nr:DNA mismatch repair protein MutT [Prevotella sp.]